MMCTEYLQGCTDMACFQPIRAFYSKAFNPKTGKRGLVFKLQDAHFDSGEAPEPMPVPCGHCVGCLNDRAIAWSKRGMNEARYYEHNCFVTLTYDADHLPDNSSLIKRDVQLFMKRLRNYRAREVDAPLFGAVDNSRIPFFMAGEYGDTHKRPHYHAILFNCDFPDKILHGKSDYGDESKTYTSEILSKLWGKGFCLIGSVTELSIAYVARYVLKKATSASVENFYSHIDEGSGEVISRIPEFALMSRRPGIGKRFFEEFTDDLPYSEHRICLGLKGFMGTNKYYDSLFDQSNPEQFVKVKALRKERALLRADDNTPFRLAVRKECFLALQKLRKRNLG